MQLFVLIVVLKYPEGPVDLLWPFSGCIVDDIAWRLVTLTAGVLLVLNETTLDCRGCSSQSANQYHS